MKSICPCLAQAAAVCIASGLLMAANDAWGAGRWNMPSTGCQMMGTGFGAGYHAPVSLGRCWKTTTASPGVIRTPHPIGATGARRGAVPRQYVWPLEVQPPLELYRANGTNSFEQLPVPGEVPTVDPVDATIAPSVLSPAMFAAPTLPNAE